MLKPRPKINALVSRRTGPSRPTSFRPPPKRAGLRVPDDAEKKWEELRAKRAANGGWSDTPSVPFKDYPLFSTKRELKEGIRYHVMRFNRGKEEEPVDPTNQDQFSRPVSLHRRDARALQFGRGVVKDEDTAQNLIDDAEAERQRLFKEQQDAQRAANQAQIAPVIKKDEPPKPKLDKKQKALSTYYPKNTDEQKKASSLRYEETLPWHLEDVDGKNVWIGSYVAALSEVNVALVISGGGFRMIPLERYYKFNHKRVQNVKSLEEAEKEFAKRETGADRWALQDQKRQEEKMQLLDTRKFLGGGAKVKMESATSRAIPKTERRDDNDIDLSGDEFQDDDENPGFDADDEDTKDAKERLRRDHLAASIFAEVKEEEVEKEEKEEKLEKLRDKIQGKKLRKTLIKRDQNYNYASDDSDSDNPFASSSESDSDEEKDKDKDKDKEEADKKEEEKKAADQNKLASGSNTKGNTTPSGKQKAPDMTKKIKSLKRPADPNVSDSSGNESTRKLKKIKSLAAGASGSANASRSGTPLPRRPGGAASDGEGTANEGSDGGKPRPKKIKLKAPGTATGTPTGSRAGSPAPQAGKSAGVATNDFASARSPAGSPPPASGARGAAGSTKPITGEEIVELIVSNGGAISIQELLQRFKGRVGDKPGQMLKADWVKLVKNHAVYDKDKMLRPKVAKAAAASAAIAPAEG
jgi:transcription initiation factor TFIIF subunit alpha